MSFESSKESAYMFRVSVGDIQADELGVDQSDDLLHARKVLFATASTHSDVRDQFRIRLGKGAPFFYRIVFMDAYADAERWSR